MAQPLAGTVVYPIREDGLGGSAGRQVGLLGGYLPEFPVIVLREPGGHQPVQPTGEVAVDVVVGENLRPSGCVELQQRFPGYFCQGGGVCGDFTRLAADVGPAESSCEVERLGGRFSN